MLENIDKIKTVDKNKIEFLNNIFISGRFRGFKYFLLKCSNCSKFYISINPPKTKSHCCSKSCSLAFRNKVNCKNKTGPFSKEARQKALNKSLENGTFSLLNLSEEAKRIRAIKTARIRIKNGTHNFQSEDFYSKRIWKFGREGFYKEKLNLISFESIDKEILLEDIDSLINIPGVWSRWSNDMCLNVCQTNNIGREMLLSIRKFDSLKNLKTYKKNNPGIEKSWWEVYLNELKDSNNNIIFKLVAINIFCKEERELIEAQYAHDNKARYWNPAPGQIIKNKENILCQNQM